MGVGRRRDDSGAVAVLYAVVFVFALVPLLALGTTTYVQTSTAAELQRAADSGALAGASALPLGNLPFAVNYVNATSGGSTTQTLSQLGLSYPYTDPLQLACQQAMRSATDPNNVSAGYAGPVSCTPPPVYVSIPGNDPSGPCATALSLLPPPLPGQPDLTTLAPALVTPGVQVSLQWSVTGPLDQLVGGSGTTQTAVGLARRRFKDMVVIPVTTLPTGTTFNIDPLVSGVRTTVSNAVTTTDQLLTAAGTLGSCVTALNAEEGDLLDAVDPPSTGPQPSTVLAIAASAQTPIVLVEVVEALGVPFLEFVPVCVENSGIADASGSTYVAHTDTFGVCTVVAPGAFRASLRRS